MRKVRYKVVCLCVGNVSLDHGPTELSQLLARMDMSFTLTSFEGTEEEDIEDWLDRLDRIGLLKNWDEKIKLEYLMINLGE